jgi:flavin-dependent dehydrogenase
VKVAIIGAGTSGLSCAIELERNGIYPVIFERNNFIGEYHSHVSALLGLISRPASDPIKYIEQNFGIKIKPLNSFHKVIHYSPNNQVDVTGQLGYFLLRSKEENSLQGQLYSQIKSQVHFKSFVTPEELENEFDHIVVADGQWSTPERFGIWQEIMRTWMMGGIFEGEFEEDTLQMWLDSELTNGVYIYAAPYSKNKAVIAHVVQNIEQEELNDYWQRFLESRNILKKYDMVDSWQLPHHAGFVTTNKVGKIYFAGAAGGGAEPFLGFGQFNAIVSGVMVGRSIWQGADINLLLSDSRKRSSELYTLRKLFNTANNQDLDSLLTVMKTPGVRSMVYKTNIDIIKLLSKSIKMVLDESKMSKKGEE